MVIKPLDQKVEAIKKLVLEYRSRRIKSVYFHSSIMSTNNFGRGER